MCGGNSGTAPRNSHHEVITGSLYARSLGHEVSMETWSRALSALEAGVEMMVHVLLYVQLA